MTKVKRCSALDNLQREIEKREAQIKEATRSWSMERQGVEA